MPYISYYRRHCPTQIFKILLYKKSEITATKEKALAKIGVFWGE